jgi:hypothetical protein
MKIDWDKTIDEILADKLTCPRCGSFTNDVLVGYSREPWGTNYAPRCKFCDRKENCEARKLVVLCAGCARDMGLRARRVDQETMMRMLLSDCRKDLEECRDYLAEYWQEDLDVPPDSIDKRLEEFDPETFEDEDQARKRLEDEYLTYHRWFRGRGIRIPSPEWRAQYVEDIVGLGYTTLLGD